MTITTTKLYKLLASQMNEETAETLTNFIEEKVKEDINDRINIFLTKEDKIDMIDRINKAEKNLTTRLYAALALAVAIIGVLIKVKF